MKPATPRELVVETLAFPSVTKWAVKIAPPPRHHITGVIGTFETQEQAESHRQAVLAEFKTAEAAAESMSQFIEKGRRGP